MSRRWHTTTIVLILALAALFRLVHLGDASFTHTEAWRANWTYSGGWDQARRFPPLQFVMCRAIQHVAGRREMPLRVPYALAGVGCVLAVYSFSRRFLNNESALLIAALVMAHPVLVYYSRRQLEYSLEAFATPAVLWAGGELYHSPSMRRWGLFLGTALLGLGFTFTAVLSVAAWTPILLLRWFHHDSETRRSKWVPCLAVAVLMFAVAGWYVWLSGAPIREAMTRYYDEVESVWPVSYGLISLAHWFAAACYGAGHFVLGMSDTWSPLNWFLGALYALAVCAALGFFWKNTRPFALFTGIMIIEAVLFGMFRLWPFGNIRHTTYLIPIAMVTVGAGLGQLMTRMGKSGATMFLLAVCVVLPVVRAAKATVLDPRVDEHIRPVFEYVISKSRPGDAWFVYYFSRDAFGFYDPKVNVPMLIQPGSDRGDLPAFAKRFDDFARRHARVWFVFSHNWKTERQEWIGHLNRSYELVDQIELPDASAHLYRAGSLGATSEGSCQEPLNPLYLQQGALR